jgi:hypothetical protein
MIFRLKSELIATVVQRWKELYYSVEDKKWKTHYMNNNDKIEIYNKLTALKNPTEQDIIDIIGNNSWTENRCAECSKDSDLLIRLGGSEDDYYPTMLWVCEECLEDVLDELKIYKQTMAKYNEN